MTAATDLVAVPEDAAGGTLLHPTPVTPSLLRAWCLPEPTGTKYSRGQVLVIGGARATPGAAMLSGLAALRMGAGRLTLAVAESIAPNVAVAIPESGAIGLPERDGAVTGEGVESLLGKELGRTGSVLLGPGLDEPLGTGRLLTEVLAALPDDTPVVLDAYGATVLPDVDRSVWEALSGRLVLTPNTGELARLLQRDDVDDDEVAEATVECAKRYGAAVGCNTWVAFDGHVWQMTEGDTGLGTSGSGDVMAGAVAGLLARGAGLAQALVWGKHVHAAAGVQLNTQYGRIGYLAGELGAELPRVMRTLGGD